MMNNIKRGIILFASVVCIAFVANAQEHKIVNPDISYSGTPRTCTIGGIAVEGIKNYEDYVLIGLSGLQVGQTITVPGNEITEAVKRYWKHGLFSKADILSEMDKVFTNFMQMQTKEDDEYVFETVGDDGIPKVVFDDDGEQIDLQTYVKNKIYNINSYILNVQDGKLKALTPVVSSLQLDIINPNTEIKCNIK